MYTRMLIPLDGSKVAEQVLPYARFLAKGLVIPVDFLEVVDPEALALLSNPRQGRYVDTILAEGIESSKICIPEFFAIHKSGYPRAGGKVPGIKT